MNERIEVADMCQKHQALLVQQAKVGPEGPWRALIIMAQIALFQAMTCNEQARNKVAGDPFKYKELGCMACFLPDRFGEIVDAAQKQQSIKELGERWVKEFK